MDTERGYRSGLTIRRMVGQQWLPAELRDRGVVGEVCLPCDNVSQQSSGTVSIHAPRAEGDPRRCSGSWLHAHSFQSTPPVRRATINQSD